MDDSPIEMLIFVIILAIVIGFGVHACNKDVEKQANNDFKNRQELIDKGYFEQEYCSSYSKKWVKTLTTKQGEQQCNVSAN